MKKTGERNGEPYYIKKWIQRSVLADVKISDCLYLLLMFSPHPCVHQEGKKQFDKETERYYSVLEKHLSLSPKKKESQLLEVNSAIPKNTQDVSPTC